jgi:hypothetical protein
LDKTAIVWSKRSSFGQNGHHLVKTAIIWSKRPSFGQNGHHLVKTAIIWSKRPSFGQNGHHLVKNNGATGKSTVGRTRHAVSLQDGGNIGNGDIFVCPRFGFGERFRSSRYDAYAFTYIGFFLNLARMGAAPHKTASTASRRLGKRVE